MVGLYLLGIIMILGAIYAIWTPNLAASAISMGIIGFSLTICFLILQAPDLAIVQVVVETLSLIILLAAIIKSTSEDTRDKETSLRFGIYAGSILFMGILLILFIEAVSTLPKFGAPELRMASDYIAKGLDKTGAANIVAAVILNLRGYDTLGEATILFTAATGVIVVLRKLGRKK